MRPGDVVVSLGTSGTVYAVSEQPTADATGAVAGFADATGRYLPLVCTLNATKVTDAVAGLLGVDHDGLDALAANAAPGAGGLTLLPYLDGERTPNRPGASGVLAGLRSDVSRAAAGAGARSRAWPAGCWTPTTRSSALAPTDGRLLLTGGGARSTTYRQVLADLTGRVVTVPALDEAVATGACIQAAAVLLQQEPTEVAASWGLHEGEIVEPGPGQAAAAEVRAAYRARRDLEA